MINKRVRLKILTHLREEWRFGDGGSCWKSFAKLATELHENLRTVKAECRRMKRDGILHLTWLTDGDGRVCGSGYLLTSMWDK